MSDDELRFPSAMTATRLLLAIGLLTAAGDAMAIEKLPYRTIEQDGDVELRRVEPHVVAETFVEGDFEGVGSEGFRRLVGYIGGANRKQAKIAMTAPVGQEPASEKIAMTAPVGQEPASEKIAMTAPVGQQKVADRYRITFVMPSKYTLANLPQPTDERIQLRDEPARTVAAIRYTGFWSRSRYDVHEQRLREWIEQRGLEPVGEPVWARYDPPFMPWFLRRNEILIELRPNADG
ncbi:MAG: heme-binding protein [Myxococcota bacterium]|nr:heme-binding protein [Myxococcota bacterium]